MRGGLRQGGKPGRPARQPIFPHDGVRGADKSNSAGPFDRSRAKGDGISLTFCPPLIN